MHEIKRVFGLPDNASDLAAAAKGFDGQITEVNFRMIRTGEKRWREVQNVGCLVSDVPTSVSISSRYLPEN